MMTQYTTNSKPGCVLLWPPSTGTNVWWSSPWLENLGTNHFLWKCGRWNTVDHEELSGNRLWKCRRWSTVWKWRSFGKEALEVWEMKKNEELLGTKSHFREYALCCVKKIILGMKKMNQHQKNPFSHNLGKSSH